MPRTKAQQKHTNLRKARERRQMSQAALAKLIDCPQSSLCGWERGKKTPHLSKLPALARALRVSVGDIVKWFA